MKTHFCRNSRALIVILMLLAFARAGMAQVPTVLGNLPTVVPGTPGSGSVLPNPKYYNPGNPAFKYWFPTQSNVVSGLIEIGAAGLDSTNTYAPLQVSFMASNCVDLEWEALDWGYGSYQIEASDGLTNYISFPSMEEGLYPNSSPTLYKINLPYQTNWNVTIIQGMDDGSFANFAGINLPSGGGLYPPSLPHQKTLVVLGDSYAKGYVPYETNSTGQSYPADWLDGFAMDLRYYASNVRIYPAGVGGQGYVLPYNVPPIYVDRVTNDVININPDFVLVTGSINDNSESSNSVYQAATNLYATLVASLPNTKIGVIGNWYKGPGIYAADIAQDQALQLAAKQYGLPYASPVQGQWGPGGVGSDSVHPTVMVYSNYAVDITTNLTAWWGTNWSVTGLSNGTSTNSGGSNGGSSGSNTNNSSGDPAISVASYGAVGNAISFSVHTVSNSVIASVLGTNTFSSADIGKIIEVFRAGPWVTYSNWGVVVTQQDILCTITNVVNGTNLFMTIPAGWTTNAYCVVGNNNAPAFQAAINAAQALVAQGSSSVTINVPAGTYLLLSSNVLNPNYVMSSISDTHPALTVSSGGITFLGASPTNTILMGCGAGMEHLVNSSLTWISPGYAPYVPMRDTLFYCLGPVANSQLPLVFQNLTFDGGLTNGLQSYNYWTPIQADGDGWDTTHHAVADYNPYPSTPQMNQLKVFTNCVFQHWRGEVLICWTQQGGTNTFNDIANCVFQDGNATADNMYYGQHIHGCTFNGMVKVMEYYQLNATLPVVFENNLWTNIMANPLSIVGSTTNVNPQNFTIQNNVMYGVGGENQITFSPAENVTVVSNVFHGPSSGVVFTAAGEQPTDGSASMISNIVISCNSFNDTAAPITMDGFPVADVLVTNNTSSTPNVAFAVAAAGFKTNIVFADNTAAGWLDSRGVQYGSYFIDQTNNSFGSMMWLNGAYSVTNVMGYSSGRYHQILWDANTDTFYLDDTVPNLIPAGAVMTVTNSASTSAKVYGSGSLFLSALSGPSTTLASGQSASYVWTNGFWRLISPNPLQPPQQLKTSN